VPIRPENAWLYPANWSEIRDDILIRAGYRCEWCGAADYEPHPETGARVILTVAHLNHEPGDCRPNNLKALCQRCHNRYDREHRNETRRRRQEAGRQLLLGEVE